MRTYQFVFTILLLLFGHSNAISDKCYAAQAKNTAQLAGPMSAQVCGNRTKVESVVSDILSACLNTSFAPIKGVRTVCVEEAEQAVQALGNLWSTKTGIPYAVDFVPLALLNERILSIFKDGKQGSAQASLYNAFMYEASSSVQDVDAAGAFLDLREYVQEDSTYNWAELLPFVRDTVSVFKGRIIGAPVSLGLPYMFYRADVFQSHNLAVPDTWEQLLQLAARINGTDWNGDGQPDFALCLMTGRNSLYSYALFFQILGSMTLTLTSKGMLLDPLTLSSLASTSAGTRAMEIFRALTTFAFPEAVNYYNSSMAYDQCAIAVRGSEVFKFALILNNQTTASKSGFLAQKIGTALIPGSPSVLDRRTGQLIGCETAAAACSDTVLSQGALTKINRAFFPVAAIGLAINQFSERSALSFTWDALITTVQPALVDQFSVFNPFIGGGPMRAAHMNVATWMRYGFAKDPTAQFLEATRVMVQPHPNIVADPMPLTNALKYRAAVDDALWRITEGGWDIPTALTELGQDINNILPTNPQQRSDVQQLYWSALGFSEPDTSPTQKRTSTIAAAITVPVAVCVLLAGGAVLWCTCRGRHRTILGKAVAPTGPDTTLVITDIQDSTRLWDMLDARVMDAALALHHTTLRAACAQRAGYESGTEGDSCILAFHNPSDAACFAVDAQRSLLHCAWPVELLAVDGCVPQFVSTQTDRSLVQGVTTSADAQGACCSGFWHVAWRKVLSRRSGGQQAAEGGAGNGDMPATSDRRSHLQQGSVGDDKPSGGRDRVRHTNTYPQLGNSRLTNELVLEVDAGTTESNHSLRLHQDTNPRHHSGYGSTPGDVASTTVQQHLMDVHCLVDGPGPGRVQIFGGLRVRVGIHTGLGPGQAVYSRTAGRMQYTGAFMAAAKDIQDAAQGGMVLMSAAAKAQLDMDACPGVVVAHMGEHVLGKAKGEAGGALEPVYVVCNVALLPRLAFMGPVRSLPSPAPSAGFLHAPYASAAMCFLSVVGITSLQAHDTQLAAASLAVYRATAAAELRAHGGYLVEESDGLVLAAFRRPLPAISWALGTVAACLGAEWPHDLLAHELGEEIAISVAALMSLQRPAAAASQAVASAVASGMQGSTASGTTQLMLFRGLRLKAGVDMGQVMASVHKVLGRMTYRGRVMNRAARIQGAAKTGQVWASADAWAAAASDMRAGQLHGMGRLPSSSFTSLGSKHSVHAPAATDPFAVTPLGGFKLKGVQEEVALVHCRLQDDVMSARPGHDSNAPLWHAEQQGLEL